MKFNEILTNHYLSEPPYPLWKIKLSNEEYNRLKQELRDAFAKGNQLFRIAKEATLYYANWWSKEYMGGNRDSTPSKEKIAASLGINSNQSDELFLWAKRGLSQLRISPIFRNGRTHYFRTLLLQGGLPIKSIKEGNNKSNYGAFFEGLIKYTNEVNVDYEDITFIDYLPCKNRLAPSFQTPDFYELNLLIIEDFRDKGEQSEYWELISAIFDRDDEQEKVQRIKKLLSEKKERKINETRLFSVEWNLRKIETKIALFYTLNIPKKIKRENIPDTLNNQYEFSVYLDNREIAKYNRSLPDNNGDVFFVKSRGKNELSDKYSLNTDIIIRLSSNGSFYEMNYHVPDFSEPILLTGCDSIWSIRKQRQDGFKNAVLLLKDSEWSFTEYGNIESVKFHDQVAFWAESEEIIKLHNNNSNDNIEFDNSPFLYRYEIYQLPDIKSKNRKLINNKIKFRIIYSIDDEVISKGYEISFRTKMGTWIEYSNSSCLPTGLLYFRFYYPDNKTEYVNFFNIGALSVNYSEQMANSGVIHIDNWNGHIQPCNEQNGIEKFEELADTKWKFYRNNKCRYYSSDLQFKINDLQQVSFADIFIASPFKGIVVTDFFGNMVDKNSSIALHSLWMYKCLAFGENQISITIFHNSNRQNQRCFSYRLEKKREIPLSDFEESINNLFILFGTDHTNYDSFITIKFDADYSIYIRPFNVNINRNEWEERKLIKLENASNINNLFAMKVDCDYADEIDIIELKKKDDNCFVVPEVSEEPNGLIVFSDNDSSTDRIRPTFLNNSQGQISVEERHNSIRAEFSNSRFIDEIWDKTVMYFRLLLSNNLPLKTIDFFRIISETPLSMAKFALVLLDHQKNITPEERTKGLLMFENEFATAWHWIDNESWMQALEWCKGKYDDIAEYYIQSILTGSLLNNLEKIQHLYHLVTTKIIADDNHIDEQRFIQNYMQYVDIQSEDWLIKDEEDRVIFPKLKQRWQNLFTKDYGYSIKTFLWGPAKAALSVMGKDTDEQGNKLLWMPENETQRRIIFYYWKLNPEAYTELFSEMVKKINYRLNHNR